ncbi:ATP-binding protein [Alkalisalibacterium limincola]|uniref:Sensory/regulatory protein RpfC n=1 Tax=Alkalisalibacterium limincola TaxID=2699169 RepID=A0A5C8KN32_9GAMM|nr:ATP-binding protein [Alkalisalibacterium limincola]TXK60744.1 response regulator [Alkalisalibacterium limincola]
MLRQLRDSEARAQAANLAKSDFLATMSHEIRTPMIGVVGMLDVLSQSRLDGEQRRCVNVIEQSAEGLLQILGDILDFSKIEAGRLTLHIQRTDLAALVRSTVANFQGAASSKGLVLDCRVAPGLAPTHEIDPLRVRQVLANLVSNAIKFTDAGNVDVVLESEPPQEGTQRVRLRVEDTGIGVAAEAQASLFDAFTQAQEGPAGTRRPGTGLGLAICRRLAGLMGGQVEMESVAGQGTRMRFEFEARTSDQPAVALPAGEGRLQRFSRRFVPRDMPDVATAERERSLVLLVDDHPTNRLVIARQLALAGFATQSANDGDEGLALWRTGRFALVLTDVHMPRMNGYELAREIRMAEANEGRERTPVIALTAAALKGEAERCLAAGMDDYLAKPVSIATLSERMHRWLPHLESAPGQEGLEDIDDTDTLDPALMADYVGGGADAAVVTEFLAACHEDLADLERARDAGDRERVARSAHRMKGAARLVAAGEMAQEAERLEAAAREGPWADILAGITAVATALAGLEHELRRRRDRSSPASG